MRILVTNDDGIEAPGLHELVRTLKPFGEVVITAPDRERSACSHAMTMRDPLRVEEYELLGCRALEVNGYPVDCVNVALKTTGHDYDLVVGGINNGPNLGFDVTYSGTVGGAMEGALNDIPAIAVSIALVVDGAPMRYDTAGQWLGKHLQMLLDLPREPLTLINVNVPSIDFDQIQGYEFVRLGHRVHEERVERRDDPWGRPYYWQGGVVDRDAGEKGTDVWAVANELVSITPVRVEWTHEGLLERFAKSGRDSG